MKKSNVISIKRHQAEKAVIEDLTEQFMADIYAIACNRALGIGGARMARVNEEAVSLVNEFSKVLRADTKDMQYSFSVLDRLLEPIFKEEFVPAKVRYSFLGLEL